MLVLIDSVKEDLNYGVFILQCLQNDVIGKEEARNMLFINDIRMGK